MSNDTILDDVTMPSHDDHDGIDSEFMFTSPPASDDSDEFVQSTDTAIVVETLRVYGGLYVIFFFTFCIGRKYFPKLYNVRSWVPELECDLAKNARYGFFSWAWKVFEVSDDDILDQCSMDALCFLRCLRLGTKVSLMGMFNAIWLIPLYLTAEESRETQYLHDPFVLMSSANLPSGSKRFSGPVLAAYIIVLYALYLLRKEYDWYVEFRHKYLSKRLPRSYAVYVSGIPEEYRSSYLLADFFRRCSAPGAVLEAHVAMDIPTLENKCARRDRVVAALEHITALERKKGVKKMHRTFGLQDGVKKVEAVEKLQNELEELNNFIAPAVVQNRNINHRFRSRLTRKAARSDLLLLPDGSRANLGPRFDDESFYEKDPEAPQNVSINTLDPIPEAHGAFPHTDDVIPPIMPSTDSSMHSMHSIYSSASSSSSSTIEGEIHFNEESPSFGPSASFQEISDGHQSTNNDNDNKSQRPDSPVHPFLALFGLKSDLIFSPNKNLDLQSALSVSRNDTSGNDNNNNNNNETEPTVDPNPPFPKQDEYDVIDNDNIKASEDCESTTSETEVDTKELRRENYNSDGNGSESLSSSDCKNKRLNNDMSPFRMESKAASTMAGTVPTVAETVLSEEEAVVPAAEENAEQLPTSNEVIPIGEDTPTMVPTTVGLAGKPPKRNLRENLVTGNSAMSSLSGEDATARKPVSTQSLESGVTLQSSDTGGERSSSGSSSKWRRRTQLSSFHNSSMELGKAVGSGTHKISQASIILGKAALKSVETGTNAVISSIKPESVTEGVKKVGKASVQGVKHASSFGARNVRKAAEFGVETIKNAPEIGATLAASAAAVAPILRLQEDGKPREAGFVVFTNLYSAQAAIQMLQHPSPDQMVVTPAPNPDDLFWRNVGLPHDAKRTGLLLSLGATVSLCFFWSVPVAFLASATEVNSLKEALPFLKRWIRKAPFVEGLLALVAPLLLLAIGDVVLPGVLKQFATWEGHIASPVLEASLFFKLCAFVLIQTFFVSALSGSISAELGNILNNPEDLIDLLANSLPAQSSYFLQIILVFTFLFQGMHLVRAYALGVAFLHRLVAPRLTKKERRTTWRGINSLEDPPDFWHAEIFAQIILYFVVLFVYAPISPVTAFFLYACFWILECGYRYHFIHNQKTSPDSGGRIWKGFIQVFVACIVIGELTLIGLLILKKWLYASAALAPLVTITVLFWVFVIPERNYVSNCLPTKYCMEIDNRNTMEGLTDMDFARNQYLQPALKAPRIYPEIDDDEYSSNNNSSNDCDNDSELGQNTNRRNPLFMSKY